MSFPGKHFRPEGIFLKPFAGRRLKPVADRNPFRPFTFIVSTFTVIP